MRFRQAVLTVNQKTYLLQPERANSFDEVFVAFEQEPEHGGTRYSVFLHPKQDLTVQRLDIQFDLPLSPDARFLANGFLSQSESRLYRPTEAIARLRGWAGRRFGRAGDDLIPGIPRGRGYLHSWTYAWVFPKPVREGIPERCCGVHTSPEQRSGVPGSAEQGSGVLLGSLNESTGLTLFLYDQPNGVLTVRKNLAGLQLSHSFPALDFGIWEGEEAAIFDAWFQAFEMPRPFAAPALAWTSRQDPETGLNETGLLQQLDRVAGSGLPFRYFMIGDGWQRSAGDWLSGTSAFPNGLGVMAQKIREKSLLPALWLAPFVAARDSELAAKHPEWLLKGSAGRPLPAGNFRGGKPYFGLDFYNNEVRNYLGGLFHAVLDRWGYEMLHLDLLSAVCGAPPPGKTRGQVMYEAMDFLRKLAGPKTILAAGVPLGATIGLADFCRTGSINPGAWENRLENWLHHRERESTLASLRSALGRWQLDGRAFGLAPGIFTLKTEKSNRKMAQQQTVLTIQCLLGSLLLTSDDPGEYTPEQKAELEAALDLCGSRIISIREPHQDVYKIGFEKDGQHYTACCNLTKRPQSLIIHTASAELQPFESLILSL